MGRGIRAALGPVALTTAAPQRAEEEKDRNRLHHPQGSSRAGFHFFPSFPLPGAGAAGAVSFWPPAPTSALLKPWRNRPHEHQDLHKFQPKGYFQREVSDFLPSSYLAQHPADDRAGSPQKPGKAPVPKGPCVAAGTPTTPPGSPAQICAPRDVAQIQLYPCFFVGCITPPEPLANQLFHDPNSCWGHTAVKGPCQPPKQSQGAFIPQTGFFQGWKQVFL